MSVLLIRHTRNPTVPDASLLPTQLAGQPLQCLHCGSLPALARCLDNARQQAPSWVLIENTATDEAQWALHGRSLCSALDALPSPYIEIARSDADTLEAHLHPHHAATALVVCSTGTDEARRLSLAITTRLLSNVQGA